MGIGELLFLCLLGLLIFGPRRLPEIARQMAKIMTDLRRASNEFRYSLEDEIRELERTEQERKRVAAIEAPVVVEGTVARPNAIAVAEEGSHPAAG